MVKYRIAIEIGCPSATFGNAMEHIIILKIGWPKRFVKLANFRK